MGGEVTSLHPAPPDDVTEVSLRHSVRDAVDEAVELAVRHHTTWRRVDTAMEIEELRRRRPIGVPPSQRVTGGPFVINIRIEAKTKTTSCNSAAGSSGSTRPALTATAKAILNVVACSK